MRHPRFLPLFFSFLAIAFAVVAGVRISMLSSKEAVTATVGNAAAMIATTGRADTAAAAPALPPDVPAPRPSGDAVTRTSPVSPREQRYEELLRTAPPAPAHRAAAGNTAAPEQTKDRGGPAPAPSALARIVAPIAEALGIERAPKERVAAAGRPTTQPQTTAAAPETSPKTEDDAASTPAQTTTDAEEDVTPPTLISIEFVPPEITDGQSTTAGVIATDDVSNVRSVSGVIATPTGAIQGFSCQRDSTNRFTATIAVPADAAEGEWNVKLLTLTDNASNSVTLNRALGTMPAGAGFRVVSRAPDEKGPVLTSAWLDHPAMRAGERNTLFVEADDDRAGVAQVSGVLISPGRQARIGFGCQAGSGKQWQCSFAAPACIDCGIWKLQQIQLQDKAGNTTAFRGDNRVVAAVQVEITGDRCDSSAPVVTALQFDPAVVSNSEDNIVRIRATAADEGCGAASISGQVAPKSGAGGQRASFSLEASGDGTTFTGTLTIKQHAATGVWSVISMQTLDRAQNLRVVTPTDPAIAGATFRVE